MKVVVVGASDLTEKVIRELVEKGHQVLVFDDIRDFLEKLEAELDITGAVVNFLDFDELERYGFSKTDILILAHRDDSVNLALGTYAKTINIPKIILVSRNSKVAEVVSRLGIASRTIVIGEIIEREVSSLIHGVRIVKLPGNKVLATLDTDEVGQIVGMTIKDLKDRWNIEVIKIVDKEGSLRDPLDDYTIREGDVVVVLGERRSIEDMMS